MSADAAFLRAILDHPDEDGPRLVFADWLDERGDAARAEFVRVQCQLARLADHDPRRGALEDRERELLARHEPAWLGELPQAVRAWAFRRGFLDRVTVRAEAGAVDWTLPPTVSALVLDMVHARGHGPAAAAGAFLGRDHPARLTALELQGGWPTGDWDRRELVGRLARLALWHVPIGDADWQDRLRDRLTGVTELELSGGWRMAEGLAGLAAPHWAERWTGLAWLPAQPAPQAVALLAACRNLRRLHLNSWPPQPAAPWPHLAELTVDAPATLPDLARLAAGDRLSRLHRLGLAIDGLRTGGLLPPLAEVLGGLARPVLHLRVNRFEQKALEDLLHDQRCRRHLAGLTVRPVAQQKILRALGEGPLWDALAELDLIVAQGPAADELPQLLRSPALGRLRRLGLACHRFSAAAAGALAGSRYLDQLRELSVEADQFGPGALATLASWPGLARLTRLNLSADNRPGFDLHLLADSPALGPLTELHLACPHAPEDEDALATLRVRLGRRLG